MEAILLGIDGTGPLSNETYDESMHNSFVSYIVRQSKAVKQYMRGPYGDGLDMGYIVATGYKYVHLYLSANPKATVLLTGYSRGGAGVIGVAKRLARDDVRVSAMVLFDAVDRSMTIDAEDIPTNVDHVVYARRDKRAKSRWSFGNCGTRWHAPTKMDIKYFIGTHGALGGVPWQVPPGKKKTDLISEGVPELYPTTNISYADDRYAAFQVWTWVKPRLGKFGFIDTTAL